MNKTCQSLIESFRNPADDYGPLMMWFWNDNVTEERITWELEKFREQNITNFFIHPAVGFDIEYLSDRYMELIQYVVREAKRLGMHYWIYDEYEFPSGTAGGILCRDYPEYRQKELRVEDHTLHGPGFRVNVCRPGEFVGAQLIIETDEKTFVQDISDQCRLTRHGEYTELDYIYNETNIAGRALFYFSEYNLQLLPSGTGRAGADNIPGYVDMFNPAAVGKFLELTHERYKQYIGDEFGKTVRGAFTDEPTSLRHFDYSIAGPWSDTFAAEFEKDHGYSILPWLYTLWTIQPKSPEEIKAVHDYRATVKRLYFNAFMKQYRQWCHDNNLIFTGHFGGEEIVMGHLFQGDMLEELTLFDMPGMDSIFSSFKIDWLAFDTAAKLSTTAAKFCGSKRILSETYTGSGWYMRLPTMQRIANRLMVLGVNWIQYMGAHYSMGGAAKSYVGALPPNHSFVNTLYRQYRDLGGYMASYSALSAATTSDAQALLFIPVMQQEQENYLFMRGKWNEIVNLDLPENRAYVDNIMALIQEGIGYDLFSEHMTDKISVHDGYVEAFGFRYNTLIFPRMFFINDQTKKLIENLRAHNVRTVFTHMIPGVNVDTGMSFDFGFNMKALPDDANVESDGCVYFIKPSAYPESLPPQEAEPEELSDADYAASLASYMSSMKLPDLSVCRAAMREVVGGKVLNVCADNGIYITRRTAPGAEVYFIANDKPTAANVEIDALPGMHLLSHATCHEVPYTVENGRMRLTLGGFEMIAIVRDPESTEMPVSTAQPSVCDHTVTLEAPYTFAPADGNYLPLNYEMYNPVTDAWDTCPYMQFSPNVHLTKNASFKLRSRVQIDHLPQSVLLNAEVQRVTRLAVNGTELDYCCNCVRWSPADYTTDIASLLHEGENIIEVEGYTENIAKRCLPPYFYLSGDFCVDADDHMTAPVRAIPACGWEKAGFPYFCGDGIYTVTVTPEEGFKKITLTTNTADAVKVYVNGEYAGQKLWLADELDLTALLQPGENRIEVHVTSTRSNMFACDLATWQSSVRTENGILRPMQLHYYR